MKKMEKIKTAWLKSYQEAMSSEAMKEILDGNVTKEQYANILRQIFLQVRNHPQMLASMTARLTGDQRRLAPQILKHAISETGHDELARKDLEALGISTDGLEKTLPLPETTAMYGLQAYLIHYADPLAYLGYLFHLEFTPTTGGKAILDALKKAGIPENALTFIQDHSEIDVAHNRLMERYVDEMVQTEEQLSAVIYAAQTTAKLYSNMIAACLQTNQYNSYGIDYLEAKNLGLKTVETKKDEAVASSDTL